MKSVLFAIGVLLICVTSGLYAKKQISPNDETDLRSTSVDIVRAYDTIWITKKMNNTTVLLDIAYNYLSLDYKYSIETDDGERAANFIFFDGGILYSGEKYGIISLNSVVLLDTETDKTNWAMGENLLGAYYEFEHVRVDLAQIGEIKPYYREQADGTSYFHKKKGSMFAMEYYSEYNWFSAWLFNVVVYDYSGLVIFDDEKVRSVRIKGGVGDEEEKLEYSPVINYLHYNETYQAGVNYKNYLLDDHLFVESELIAQFSSERNVFALGHLYATASYYPLEPRRHNINRQSRSCVDRGCSCIFSFMFYPYLKAGYAFTNEMIYSNVHGLILGGGVESHFFKFSFEYIYNYYESLVQLSVIDEDIYRFKLTGYF